MLRETLNCNDAIRSVARLYALEGESLATFLDDLQEARDHLGLPRTPADTLQNASIAWAAATFDESDAVPRADPLTGLVVPVHASAHLRSLYRRTDADLPMQKSFALVIVSLLDGLVQDPPAQPLDMAFHEPMRMALVTGTVRATFDRCELLTPLGAGRILAVVERDPFVENRIEELQWLLRRRLPINCAPRVHAIDMPATETEIFAILAELTRGEGLPADDQ